MKSLGFRTRGVALCLFVLLALVASAPARGQSTPRHTGPGVGEYSTPINTVPAKREQENDTNDAYRHSAMVVKLGSIVGMNGEQAATAFEVLNFLLLVVALGWFAVKSLPKVFRDRSSAIQRQLVDARTATEESTARLNAVEDRLGRLDAEIAAMRSHVEAETARDEQRMRVQIEEETAKILEAAEGEIQAATAAARRELQRHAAELAIDHAAQRLVVTADTDRLLIQRFAERLSGEKGGQN